MINLVLDRDEQFLKDIKVISSDLERYTYLHATQNDDKKLLRSIDEQFAYQQLYY